MKTVLLSVVVVGALAGAAEAAAQQRSAPPVPPAQGASAPARGTAGAAQAPARGVTQPPAQSPAQTPPQQAAPPPPPPGPPFTYQAGSRPDPFRSLLVRVRTTAPEGTSAAGPASDCREGLKECSVNDISVRGVIQYGGAYLAMVLTPSGKTFLARAGDQLRNGTIRSVTPQGLVIVQEITDPLSTQRQREVRKLLRSFEEGNQ